MIDSYHKSTRDLINEIERKDRRFRIFQTISLLFVGAGVIILLGFYYNLLMKNRGLTSQLSTAVNSLKTDTNQKVDKLQNHIDCVTSLFARPDRSNLVISDIKNCEFSKISQPSPQQSPTISNQSIKPSSSSAPKNDTQPTPTSSPQPAPSQSSLQKSLIQPIMSLINKIKGL